MSFKNATALTFLAIYFGACSNAAEDRRTGSTSLHDDSAEAGNNQSNNAEKDEDDDGKAREPASIGGAYLSFENIVVGPKAQKDAKGNFLFELFIKNSAGELIAPQAVDKNLEINAVMSGVACKANLNLPPYLECEPIAVRPTYILNLEKKDVEKNLGPLLSYYEVAAATLNVAPTTAPVVTPPVPDPDPEVEEEPVVLPPPAPVPPVVNNPVPNAPTPPAVVCPTASNSEFKFRIGSMCTRTYQGSLHAFFNDKSQIYVGKLSSCNQITKVSLWAGALSGSKSNLTSKSSVVLADDLNLVCVPEGVYVVESAKGNNTQLPVNLPENQATRAHRILLLKDDSSVVHVAGKLDGTGCPTYLTDIGENVSATSANLCAPRGLARASNGALFIADRGHHCIRKIEGGMISTYAGKCGVKGSIIDNYDRLAARFNYPHGVAIDFAGNLLVADTWNNSIRKIGSDGKVVAVAGRTYAGYYGEDIAAASAHFRAPMDALPVIGGGFYVADTDNNKIRFVDSAGIVRLVAGRTDDTLLNKFVPNPYVTGNGDGSAALGAVMKFPRNLSLMPDGTLLFVDGYYYVNDVNFADSYLDANDDWKIRRIAPSGSRIIDSLRWGK